MTFIAKRMETPLNDYDTYIGADAIVRFLGKHANIPNCESLKAEYEAKFYTLYRILADASFKPSYTKEEEASVEAMVVLDFCKAINITANFTENDKALLVDAAREVLTQCARALIPRSAP